MIELRMHGRGGQGIVTLAELLARAALKNGLEAQTLPFFGVERRGAAVKAAVRLDQLPIKVRSMSYRPNYLVLLHANLLAIGLGEGIDPQGELVVNSLEAVDAPYPQWLVDAGGIARHYDLVVGGEPFINVPMLGALGRVLELPQALLAETINEQWTPDKAAPNLAAMQAAYTSVSQVKGGSFHA